VAERIAAEIADMHQRPAGQVVALEAPKLVTLPAPIDARVIDVVGVLEGGQRRALRWAHEGTTYECDQASVFHVDADGAVVATKEGAGTVIVRNGALQATVRLVAHWGAVVPFGRGIAGSDGKVPVLGVAGQSPRLGNELFRIVATEIPAHGDGYLVFSDKLEPHVLQWRDTYVDPTGDRVPLVRVSGLGTAEVAYPIPQDPALRGTRIFCQAFFADQGSPMGCSASNGLMVTFQ